jgi:hypothetical protein
MDESKFAEYWAQAEFCYFKAGLVRYPVSKQLWINLAHDWVALAESEVPPPAAQGYSRRKEQLEPFLVA